MATHLGGKPCIDPATLFRECQNREPPIPTEPWWGRANGFDLAPVGREPGQGWLLMREEEFAALAKTADHKLKFSGTNSKHVYTLDPITILGAQTVTPSYDGDPNSIFLVRVADRRHHLAKVPTDKAFNVRKADGTGYLTQTLNGGVAWTWQTIVNQLVTELGLNTAEFVLPFTPDAPPENLSYWGSFAWAALNDVLDRIACAPQYNPEEDDFSVIQLGASDTDSTNAQSQSRKERTWDHYPVDPVRAWRPEKVQVQFLRRPRPTDGSTPYYSVDVALTATTGVVAGTFVQLKDDLTAIGATGAPSNAAACSTRATERAADWLRKRSEFGRPLLKVYRDFIPDVVRRVPGATVGNVALDDRGGPMRTEIGSRLDMRLENWEPLSILPPWFPGDEYTTITFDVVTNVCPIMSGGFLSGLTVERRPLTIIGMLGTAIGTPVCTTSPNDCCSGSGSGSGGEVMMAARMLDQNRPLTAQLPKYEPGLLARGPACAGVVIGCFGLPGLARLQVRTIRATCGDVPILLADDGSGRDAEFNAIEEEEHGVTFWPSDTRRGHYAGDLSVFWKGLQWAHTRGLKSLCKISQRFIWTEPGWLAEAVADLKSSDLSLLAQRCFDNGNDPSRVAVDLKVRTECMLLDVAAWVPYFLEFDRPLLGNPTELYFWDLVHRHFGGRFV